MKKINRYIYVVLFMMAFILSTNKVLAADITAIVDDPDGINVRSDPSTVNDRVVWLKYGTTITLVSSTKIKTSAQDCDEWYQINYGGSTSRYVCSDYVVLDSVASVNTTGYYTTKNWGFRINENYATVRKTPNGTVVENIYLGTNVKKNSCSNGWCYITYYGTKTGYVKQALISNYSEITATVDTSDEFIIDLKAKGFPDSYLPFLAFLHNKYPNWNFNAVTMTKKFNTVVDSEEGRNAMQSPPAQFKLTSSLRENPNWYTTKSSVDAIYIDPRTYLTEKNIFAFEDVRYDSTFPNSSIMEQLFKDTYLEQVDPNSIAGIDALNTEEINKNKKTYSDYFMESGIKYGVSPAHLAARAKQEGMTNSSYVAVTGTATSVGGLRYKSKSLDGYYNFFNINAYQDSYTNSSVARGLAYAAMYTSGADTSYGKPWNTRKKAIYGGAQWISSNYVSVGQYTTYFQKFDVSPSSSTSYINQYMTNIIAPASESLYTYQSRVDANMMNTPFVFSIPVYSDLPTDFIVLQPIGDTENSLTDIKINGTTLLNFDSDVVEYQQYIPSTTTSVALSATAKSSRATVAGTGTINITSDTQSIYINVTSEVGILKTYKITLIKATTNVTEETSIDEIMANVAVRFSNSYLTGLGIDTTSTSISSLINANAPTISINITNKSGTAKSGNLVTGDIITITNGSNSKSYTFVLKGDNNGDGSISILDLLRVQKHILKASTLTNENFDACDTNYDGKIDILDLLRVQKHILGYLKLK